jgi:ribonuclease PH
MLRLLPAPVSSQPDGHSKTIKTGQTPQKYTHHRRTKPPGPPKNNFGPPLLKLIQRFSHPCHILYTSNLKIQTSKPRTTSMTRPDGRNNDQLRPITFQSGIAPHATGSVLVSFGNTRVICAVTVQEDVPRWMKYQKIGGGWLTAEYNMLPYSTLDRKQRDITSGRLDGRSSEIQRLIGRSLRAVVDLKALGPRTIWLDCDVLQADGGTRTASITGGCVAIAIALNKLLSAGKIKAFPMKKLIAGISSGIYQDTPILDLDYPEDKNASVDFNIVMTEDLEFVELQGSGEESVFTSEQMTAMLDLARKGVTEITALQKQAILDADQVSSTDLDGLANCFKRP